MKPITAASKLDIHLPSAPEEFQRSSLTRSDVEALRANPPEWLVELRRNGPFPRDVVAQKLGVSRSGLARAGVTEALDADPDLFNCANGTIDLRTGAFRPHDRAA